MHALTGIFLVAVKDRVCDGLTQRNLYIVCVAFVAGVMLQALHELVHKRRDRGNVAGHGKFKLRMRRTDFPSFVQIHSVAPWWPTLVETRNRHNPDGYAVSRPMKPGSALYSIDMDCLAGILVP